MVPRCQFHSMRIRFYESRLKIEYNIHPPMLAILPTMTKMVEELVIKQRALVRNRTSGIFGTLPHAPIAKQQQIGGFVRKEQLKVTSLAPEPEKAKRDFFGRKVLADASAITMPEKNPTKPGSRITFKFQEKSAHAVRRSVSVAHLIYKRSS